MKIKTQDDKPSGITPLVSPISDRRRLRITTLTSDPETQLKNMLHNLRTQKETLKSSARKCGDSSLREPAFRNTLGKLDRIILKAERALLALKQAQGSPHESLRELDL